MENENGMPIPEQENAFVTQEPQTELLQEQPVQPQEPQYQPPVQPQYQPPVQPQYQQPVQPQYQQPVQPQYQPPVQPQYQQPVQPQYQPPVQPQYQPPVQPQYQQPVQPQYQQPVQPQYHQYGQQYQQPPKKKVAAWKIIVPIVAGVLVLAILAGVYFLFLRAKPVEKIELHDDVLYMETGDERQLYYSYEPVEADAFECVWTSSDTSVATVDDGAITAVGAGECTITLTAENGVSDSCTVTVEEPFVWEDMQIVGYWEFDGGYVDDEYIDVDQAEITMYIYTDGTGEIYFEDGDFNEFTWSYYYEDDGMTYYDVMMDDGTACEFHYYSDPGGDFYGDLTLFIDYENMIFFTN